MTRNRKADLQRKLTMAPVAKPPAGLADRIKTRYPATLRISGRERAHAIAQIGDVQSAHRRVDHPARLVAVPHAASRFAKRNRTSIRAR